MIVSFILEIIQLWKPLEYGNANETVARNLIFPLKSLENSFVGKAWFELAQL